MSFLFFLFAGIVVLMPLVALHEFGHFWVARKLGVKVLTYSIGIGPVLWKKTGKDGVDYCLSAIPLGGYVRMLDEREREVAEAEKHLAFNNQKPWKKIAIVAAGPLMNFLIAIVLFWILFLPEAEQRKTIIGKILPETPAIIAGLKSGDHVTKIDNKSVQTWQDVNYALIDSIGETKDISITVSRDGQIITKNLAVTKFLKNQSKGVFEQIGLLPFMPVVKSKVFRLADDGAAKLQGVLVGDIIQKINGKPAHDWDEMSRIVRNNPEKLLDFEVLRDTKTVNLKIMPQGKKDNMGNRYGQIGIAPDTSNIKIPDEQLQKIQYGPVEAFVKSLQKTWDLSIMTVTSMGKMLMGLIGLEGLSGPITIAKVAGDSINIGWQAVLSLVGLISVSLAVLNLLPIPILDGGHIVYYTYEAIFGRELPEKVQNLGLNLGLVIMFLFMIIAITNDISRLF